MRRAFCFSWLLLFAFLFFRGLGELRAADEVKSTNAHDSHAEHDTAAKKNPLELAADLAIWTIVVFLLLLVILRATAWKPIIEGLQKREENIRDAVEQAERARDEAKRVQAQVQARLDKASEEVREILDEARRDAQHTTDEMVAKARAEIQTDRDRLRREIETARDQALKELWEQTAQLATLVSAKAIRRHISPDDHRRLVDEALADLQTAGNQRQRELVR